MIILILIISFIFSTHEAGINLYNNKVQSLFTDFGLDIDKVEYIGNKLDFKADSKLQVREEFGIPDNHIWSRCQQCGWKNGHFILYNNSFVSNLSKVKISQSLWNEFFHTFQNDHYYAGPPDPTDHSIRLLSHLKYHIKTPIYIIPMITFHPGHLLIDVLEIIYYSMIHHYGKIRKDAIFIFDVAPKPERDQIIQKLKYHLTKEHELLSTLLYAFTSQPIVTINFLQQLFSIQGVLYDDIHILPNTIHSSFYIGYRFHPHDFTVLQSTTMFQQYATRYTAFSEYMLSSIPELYPVLKDHLIQITRYHILPQRFIPPSIPSNPSNTLNTLSDNIPVDILIIQRDDNRIVHNLEALLTNLNHHNHHNYTYKVINLAKLPISQQLYYFQHVKFIIAIGGTTFHNVIFMPNVIATVVIMQSGWCDWSWMYTNQALLLGIKSFVYCVTSVEEQLDEYYDVHSDEIRSYLSYPISQVARRSIEQGPRYSKTMNITLDMNVLVPLLNNALHYVALHSNHTINTTNTTPNSDNNHTINTHNNNNINNINALRLFISSLTVNPILYPTTTPPTQAWEIVIEAEILGQEELRNTLLSTIPSLAICNEMLTIEMSSPWCIPISELNYYATIKLTVDFPIHIAHFWLQLTSSSTVIGGGGGKISGTDIYLPMDLRLKGDKKGNDGGFGLHAYYCHHYKGKDIHMIVDLSEITSLLSLPSISIPQRLHITLSPKTLYSIQLTIPNICHTLSYNHVQCGGLAWLIYRHLHFQQIVTQSNDILPAIQFSPSPINPFVFLHIEKTGGTSIRAALAPSANHYPNISYFIPCYHPLSCMIFTLPVFKPRSDHIVEDTLLLHSLYTQNPSLLSKNKINYHQIVTYNISILSGHLYWNIWNELPQCHLHKQCKPSIFIMTRHPVARIMSYYHQRLYLEVTSGYYQRSINSFTVDEWRDVLVNQRFARLAEDDEGQTEEEKIMIVDEGMSDAACRAILGLKTTSGVVLTTQDIMNHSEGKSENVIMIPDALTSIQRLQAITNVRKSVVGVLERWNDTLVSVKHWFPWIELPSEEIKLNNNQRKEQAKDLRPELLQIILEQNQCDIMIHEEMNHLLDKQLLAIKQIGFQL